MDDFELRLSYRIINGNSGIQYRSKDRGNWVVSGYQADIESGRNYTGLLVEEGGRFVLAQRGQMTVIEPNARVRVVASLGSKEALQTVIKDEDWNDYVIMARGNHLTHIINGRVASMEKVARLGRTSRQPRVVSTAGRCASQFLNRPKSSRINITT